MHWPHVATVAMVQPRVLFHTHEYDYKGHNLAVTLYYRGVGYSPSLSIIYIFLVNILSVKYSSYVKYCTARGYGNVYCIGENFIENYYNSWAWQKLIP